MRVTLLNFGAAFKFEMKFITCDSLVLLVDVRNKKIKQVMKRKTVKFENQNGKKKQQKFIPEIWESHPFL